MKLARHQQHGIGMLHADQPPALKCSQCREANYLEDIRGRVGDRVSSTTSWREVESASRETWKTSEAE